MKHLLNFALVVLLFTNCTSNRYALNSTNKEDKNFLIEEIKKAKTEGLISSTKPIIVIDGKPYRFSHELKENKLNLSKEDIKSIEVLKQKVGVAIYGEFAKGGVLVVTNKDYVSPKEIKKEESKSMDDANILFIVDGKEVNMDYIKNLDPNTINTFTVIKGEEEIKEYTNKKYDGVIIIELKK